MHCLPFNPWVIAIAAAISSGAGLRGQDVGPPNPGGASESAPVAPLMQPGEEKPAPGGWILREEAAKRALELGFSPAAEALLRELLDSPETAGPAKNRLVLELTAALLDEGRLAEMDPALARFTGPRTSPYHLRAGLVAAYRKQGETARIEAGQVKIDDLPAPERGWFDFLQGMIADLTGDRGRRDQAYEEATKAAVSEQQRARFELERLHVKLLWGPATEPEAAALKQNMERLQGQRIGYDLRAAMRSR